jgi:hypothetical protein
LQEEADVLHILQVVLLLLLFLLCSLHRCCSPAGRSSTLLATILCASSPAGRHRHLEWTSTDWCPQPRSSSGSSQASSGI